MTCYLFPAYDYNTDSLRVSWVRSTDDLSTHLAKHHRLTYSCGRIAKSTNISTCNYSDLFSLFAITGWMGHRFIPAYLPIPPSYLGNLSHIDFTDFPELFL